MVVSSSAIIQARGLTKHFGKLVAVRDVTFEVDAGQVFGFLGPNGAGKTTTIRMLTGLVRPTSGSASVAGYDVSSEPLEVKRRIGYLAEAPYLYPKLSGREFLVFMAQLYQLPRAAARQRANPLLSLFELSDKPKELVHNSSHAIPHKLPLPVPPVPPP